MVFVANTMCAQWYGYYYAPYIPYTGNACVDAQMMASEYRLMQETFGLQQVMNITAQQMAEQLKREIQSMPYVPTEPSGHYERVRQICPECGGSKKRTKTIWMGSSGNRNVELSCSKCHGTGYVRESRYVED